MPSSSTIRKTSSLWQWVPAVAVIAVSGLIVAGFSVVQPSTAATSNQDVTVNGTVSQSISVSANPCTGGTNNIATFGSSFTSGGSELVTPTCTVQFITNATNGAKLEVNDNNTIAPLDGHFFCGDRDVTVGYQTATDTCQVAQARFDNKGAGAGALAAGEFGIIMDAIGGDAAADWNVDNAQAAGTAEAGDDDFYPILESTGTAADDACHVAAATANSTCRFAFGGQPKNPQEAGDYQGIARFLATTL